MDNSLQPPLFKEEREQTDESLTDERGKTDKSFEEFRAGAERSTDKAVESERRKADRARLERRNQADIKRDLDRENALAAGATVHERTDRHIVSERQSEDKAIENERISVDAAIHKERGTKEKLVTNLFGQEREATDMNLSHERDRTDSEVQRSAGLLSDEQTSHFDTKAELTTRDELLAVVSHDLRNPIGAIYSCTEMLMDDPSFEGIGSEAKHWIEFVKRNAASALRLISDLLDMERFAEGKLEVRLGRYHIGDLVREAIECHAHVASVKNILLRALPTNASSTVVCDRDRISQVLSNLIGNALKFTPDGGSVTVSIADTENEVRVSVCDTGPGIPIEQQDRIFERFAQLQNRDRRGLGLGLYISKTLIEAHKGRISVSSSPGQGSTFCFSLPKYGPL